MGELDFHFVLRCMICSVFNGVPLGTIYAVHTGRHVLNCADLSTLHVVVNSGGKRSL